MKPISEAGYCVSVSQWEHQWHQWMWQLHQCQAGHNDLSTVTDHWDMSKTSTFISRWNNKPVWRVFVAKSNTLLRLLFYEYLCNTQRWCHPMIFLPSSHYPYKCVFGELNLQWIWSQSVTKQKQLRGVFPINPCCFISSDWCKLRALCTGGSRGSFDEGCGENVANGVIFLVGIGSTAALVVPLGII